MPRYIVVAYLDLLKLTCHLNSLSLGIGGLRIYNNTATFELVVVLDVTNGMLSINEILNLTEKQRNILNILWVTTRYYNKVR